MQPRYSEAGFTLIELVMVMIIVGIMAFAAVPRLEARSFDEKAFRDAVAAAVQHGRRMAVAGRRYTCVNVDGATGIVALRRDETAPEAVVKVACDNTDKGVALALPAPGRGCAATNQVCAPGGVALGGASLIFDPLGRPVDADRVVAVASAAVTISNQTAVVVQPETGYVE